MTERDPATLNSDEATIEHFDDLPTVALTWTSAELFPVKVTELSCLLPVPETAPLAQWDSPVEILKAWAVKFNLLFAVFAANGPWPDLGY